MDKKLGSTLDVYRKRNEKLNTIRSQMKKNVNSEKSQNKESSNER